MSIGKVTVSTTDILKGANQHQTNDQARCRKKKSLKRPDFHRISVQLMTGSGRCQTRFGLCRKAVSERAGEKETSNSFLFPENSHLIDAREQVFRLSRVLEVSLAVARSPDEPGGEQQSKDQKRQASLQRKMNILEVGCHSRATCFWSGIVCISLEKILLEEIYQISVTSLLIMFSLALLNQKRRRNDRSREELIARLKN
jgi:hypothetical protein